MIERLEQAADARMARFDKLQSRKCQPEAVEELLRRSPPMGIQQCVPSLDVERLATIWREISPRLLVNLSSNCRDYRDW